MPSISTEHLWPLTNHIQTCAEALPPSRETSALLAAVRALVRVVNEADGALEDRGEIDLAALGALSPALSALPKTQPALVLLHEDGPDSPRGLPVSVLDMDSDRSDEDPPKPASSADDMLTERPREVVKRLRVRSSSFRDVKLRPTRARAQTVQASMGEPRSPGSPRPAAAAQAASPSAAAAAGAKEKTTTPPAAGGHWHRHSSFSPSDAALAHAVASRSTSLWACKNAFVAAEDLLTTLSTFDDLLAALPGAASAPPADVLEALRSRPELGVWTLPGLLASRRGHDEYALSASSTARSFFCGDGPPRVVVVGAGVGGLRFAVEALLLGFDVDILERREAFTRNNVVHLWDATVADLTRLGAKTLYRRFCFGGSNHIPLRRLQVLLLKICLMLGARMHAGCAFERDAASRGPSEHGRWTVGAVQHGQARTFVCDVLVGADGVGSTVAQAFGFEDRPFNSGQVAIGVVGNFQTGTSKAEIGKSERRLENYGENVPIFKRLAQRDLNIKNLIYFKSDTHYLVSSVLASGLLARGVCREPRPGARLIEPDNVDRAALEAFVRDLAVHGCHLPEDLPYAHDASGRADVQIFDFTRKSEGKTCNFKLVDGAGAARPLVVGLVGDALVEPFWPIGTGANHAVQGALDMAFACKSLHAGVARETVESIAAAAYNALDTAMPNSLKISSALRPDARYTDVGAVMHKLRKTFSA